MDKQAAQFSIRKRTTSVRQYGSRAIFAYFAYSGGFITFDYCRCYRCNCCYLGYYLAGLFQETQNYTRVNVCVHFRFSKNW